MHKVQSPTLEDHQDCNYCKRIIFVSNYKTKKMLPVFISDTNLQSKDKNCWKF